MNAGFGLRVPHYEELIVRGTRASFVEAVSENFLGRGGRPRHLLERIRRDARLALHGVSLSIGSVDPLNCDYVAELASLARECEATLVSDHLCFASIGGHYAHDLWPLPYTDEALEWVVDRARAVAARLPCPFLLENVSSYVEYEASTLSEWEFLGEVCERADIGILLDLNNVVVSAKNHGFSAEKYVDALPRGRVLQIHLAGHTDWGTHAIDDHASAVSDEVWSLYRRALQRFGPVPTIVEWDDAIPPLATLEAEASKAATLQKQQAHVSGGS
ncbi:MAG TPA: DUF692 domain-containing protein [Polyangiaceae bacterium]|nr:DUF692 domain-containing protein [Polyangiaceae bacterium]